MERTILHADANNFYASVEEVYRPELRRVPMIVGGDPELRHGIVLAKNGLAKKAGIKTAQTLQEARALCPNVVCVPPQYKLYLQYSKNLRKLFGDYTNQVEPFGLDEAWLDVTGSGILGDGLHIANTLRARAKRELGITLSVGVSYNKIFAKLGSDMKKPDATTVITESDYQTKVWPLPASDLLYVGRATTLKLASVGILTIGDIAKTARHTLKAMFGVNGHMLYDFANGLDRNPVMETGDSYGIKSIGNSTTTPRDLLNLEDAKITVYVLAESVAARLRDVGFVARTIQVSLRDNKLHAFQRQVKLRRPSQLSDDIATTALALISANYDFSTHPMRSLGIRGMDLLPARGDTQLSFLEADVRLEKLLLLEWTIDDIRRRFGHFSLQRGLMLADKGLSDLDPKGAHFTISGGFQGG